MDSLIGTFLSELENKKIRDVEDYFDIPDAPHDETFDMLEKIAPLDTFLYDKKYLGLQLKLSDLQYEALLAADDDDEATNNIREIVLMVGKGCIAGGTIIDGTGMTVQEMEEKQIPAKVYSYNETTKQVEIIQCKEPPFVEGHNYHMYEVELEDGKKMTVTPEHQFMGKKGMVMLSDLNEGDEVMILDEDKL